jgi:hypothetical protein
MSNILKYSFRSGCFIVFMEYLRQFLPNYDESRTVGFVLKIQIQGCINMWRMGNIWEIYVEQGCFEFHQLCIVFINTGPKTINTSCD